MAGKAEKRYRILVSGRVHGVCFRYYARRLARNLGLAGYVRNLEDGMVEVVAQGSENNLEKLLEFCRKGPMLARVDDVNIKEEKMGDEFEGFEVRY